MTLKGIWDAFLKAFRSFFVGFFNELSGGREPKDTAEQAGEIMAEAAEAALILVARGGGIPNPAAFIIELKAIHDAEQASGASGDEKYEAAAAAIRIAWQRFGGALSSPALQTVIDTFTALFHAPAKVAELLPPDSARTIGMQP